MWLSLCTSAPRQYPYPTSHTVSRLMPTGLMSERVCDCHPCVLAAGCGAEITLTHEALFLFLETRSSGWAHRKDWGQPRRWELCLVSPVTVAWAVNLSFPDSEMGLAFLPPNARTRGHLREFDLFLSSVTRHGIITFLPHSLVWWEIYVFS